MFKKLSQLPLICQDLIILWPLFSVTFILNFEPIYSIVTFMLWVIGLLMLLHVYFFVNSLKYLLEQPKGFITHGPIEMAYRYLSTFLEASFITYYGHPYLAVLYCISGFIYVFYKQKYAAILQTLRKEGVVWR